MSSPAAPPEAPTDAASDEREDCTIDLTEDGPPAEVLDQMARADAINSRLRASGREIHFALSADGCSLQIELRETSGELIRVLSPAEALDLAGGADHTD